MEVLVFIDSHVIFLTFSFRGFNFRQRHSFHHTEIVLYVLGVLVDSMARPLINVFLRAYFDFLRVRLRINFSLLRSEFFLYVFGVW